MISSEVQLPETKNTAEIPLDRSATLSFQIDDNDTAREITEMIMSKFPSVRRAGEVPDSKDNDHHHPNEHQVHVEHSEFPPIFVKPLPRQSWLSDGSSSLAVSNHRAATTNDLVLDLVVVFILQGIVHIVADSSLIGENGHEVVGNGTISSSSSSSSGGHHLLQTWEHFKAEADSPEWMQFLVTFRDVCAVYIPVWANWFRIATLLNRFEAFDVIHYILFAFNLLSILFVGREVKNYITVPIDGGKPDCNGFLYNLVLMQGLQIVWCTYLAYWNPTFARPLMNLSINIALTGFLYTVTALSVSLNSVWIFLVLDWSGKFSDMFVFPSRIFPWMDSLAQATCCRCTRGCMAESGNHLPPVNGPLLAERLELFLILCIGESLAAADPKGTHKINPGEESYSFWFILGVIMITICVKFIAIDFSEHPTASTGKSKNSDGAKHAMMTSPQRGAAWIFGHFPIGVGILYSAAALEASLEGGMTYWRQWALSVGTFLVTIFSTITQACHKGKKGGGRRCRKKTRVAFRCSICSLFLILPLCWPEDWNSYDFPLFLYLVIFLLVFMLLTDRYAREKKELKHFISKEENVEPLLTGI
jgi:hypothetical protein